MTPEDARLIADLDAADVHERFCSVNDEPAFPCDCDVRDWLPRLLTLVRAQEAALAALVSTCETDGGYTEAREREMLADLGDEALDKQPWKALREARRVLGKER